MNRIPGLRMLCLAAAAAAQSTPAVGDSPGNGAQAAVVCITCHGAHGEGMAAAGYPRLAGIGADLHARVLEDLLATAHHLAEVVDISVRKDAEKHRR